MIQFYNEYNEELTLPKDNTPNTQSAIAQLLKHIKAEYALCDISKPIRVSDYELGNQKRASLTVHEMGIA